MKRYATIICSLVIGLASFLALNRRCQLGNWHAPADPDEMRQLVREAMRLRQAPNDAPRLAYLDQFVSEVSSLPHWRDRERDSPVPAEYTRGELVAFIRDWTQFYNDEWHKPSETYYYYLFWIRHDFTSPDWSMDLPARTNPTLAKFLLGAAIDLQTSGPYPVRDVTAEEMFEHWWQFEPFLLAAMDRTVLLAARRTSALFGAGSLILVFLLGRRLGGAGGLATGIVAAGLLWMSPLFRYYASRATVDVMLVFCMLGGGLATTYFVPLSLGATGSGRKMSRLVLATLAMGGATALAFGVKLNGALLGIGAALGCGLGWGVSLVGWLRGRSLPGRLRVAPYSQVALSLAGVALLAFTIFFASNPHYYRNPVGRFLETLGEMDREMSRCQRVVGPAIRTRYEAVRTIFYTTTMLTGNYGKLMLMASSSAPFQPMDRVGTVAPVRFWARTLFVFGGLVLGLIGLARPGLRLGGFFGSPADYDIYVRMALAGWALALILGTAWWLPLRWDRYCLVPLAPGVILVAWGWSIALGWIMGWVGARLHATPSEPGATD